MWLGVVLLLFNGQPLEAAESPVFYSSEEECLEEFRKDASDKFTFRSIDREEFYVWINKEEPKFTMLHRCFKN